MDEITQVVTIIFASSMSAGIGLVVGEALEAYKRKIERKKENDKNNTFVGDDM